MSRSPKALSTHNESNVVQEQLSLFAKREIGEHTHTEEIMIAETEQPEIKSGEHTHTHTEEIMIAETEQPEIKQNTRAKKNGYSAADIQVLEGIAAIRHRPGMYIGSTSTSGLVHLIWEALDNAVDEAVAGYGKQVWVHIDQEGWVTVRDEGRGMPFDPMLYQGELLPAATVILTVPHSGGKFSEGAYKTAGGLHGVGSTVINALSETLELTIWKDGQQFTQSFSHGAALPHQIILCDRKLHGTQLRWLYDKSIFDPDVYYPLEVLESRLKSASYLNRGVTFHLDAWDDTENQQIQRVFYSRDGLPDYVRDLAVGTSASLFKHVIGIVKEKDDVRVEVALQPTTGYKVSMYSYANAVRTRDGGVHETGCKAALTKVVNDYALKLNIIKNREKDGFKPEVIQQGLNIVISVKLANPQFQGQTKDRLNNAPVEGIVRSVVDEGLKDWFEKNSNAGKEWLKKIQQMQKARNEAQLVEELARAGNKKNGELIDTTLSKSSYAAILMIMRGQNYLSSKEIQLVVVLVKGVSLNFRRFSNSKGSRSM